MSVFVDTSALLAAIDADDEFHEPAAVEMERLLDPGTRLISTNYVMLESVALLQRRVGMEAVRLLLSDIEPLLQIISIGREQHELAVSSLITANRRQLSLVDLTSFTVMRESHIDAAFTFDQHFAEQGFVVVPRE